MSADADRTPVRNEQPSHRGERPAFREVPGQAEAERDAFLSGAGADLAHLATALSRADGASRARILRSLQHEYGNKAVQRLLAGATNAARAADATDDRREQQADSGPGRTTDPAVPVSRPSLQRQKAEEQPPKTKLKLRPYPLSTEKVVLVKESKGKKGKKGQVVPGTVKIEEAPATYAKGVLKLAGIDPKDWFNSFTQIEFLGRKMNAPIHVKLAAHLKGVEDKLVAKGKTPKEVGDELGLSPSATELIKGGRPAPTGAPYSMHLFGLAIDLNYTANPYITVGTGTTKVTNDVLRRAGLLVKGKAMSFRKRPPGKESWKADTMETYDVIAELNETLTEYFSYVDNLDKLKEKLTAAETHRFWRIRPGEEKRVEKAVEAKSALIKSDLAKVSRAWGRGRPTVKKTGFLNLKRELVEAMDLDWGGWYGDMMHFDMRREDPGDKVYAATLSYGEAKRKEAREKWMEAEKKRQEEEKKKAQAQKKGTEAHGGTAVQRTASQGARGEFGCLHSLPNAGPLAAKPAIAPAAHRPPVRRSDKQPIDRLANEAIVAGAVPAYPLSDRTPLTATLQRQRAEVGGAKRSANRAVRSLWIKGPTEGVRATLVYVPVAVELLKPPQAVDVLLHLHGFGARASRYEEHDKIAHNLRASGRPMVAVIPQYSFIFKVKTIQSPEGPKKVRRCVGDSLSKAGFTSDTYVSAVFQELHKRGNLPKGITSGPVVLSGHSAAGRPIAEMLSKHLGVRRGKGSIVQKTPLPSAMSAVVLFDAINSPRQLEAVKNWVLQQLDDDLAIIRSLGTTKQQLEYLQTSRRFRAYYSTGGNLYPPLHARLDGEIKAWFSKNKEGLADADTKQREGAVHNDLLKHYEIIPAAKGVVHEKIVGANLLDALK